MKVLLTQMQIKTLQNHIFLPKKTVHVHSFNFFTYQLLLGIHQTFFFNESTLSLVYLPNLSLN